MKKILDFHTDGKEDFDENEAVYEEELNPEVVELVEEEPVIMETTSEKEGQEIPEEVPALSKNEQILQLYREGKDEVEIAKTLDCGLGEVRLVLGLYNNEA